MADSPIGNFNPDEFTIVLSKGDFVHRVAGFADGSFLSMDRLVPTSEPYQGVGESAHGRIKRRVTGMNVTMTLHQYSPSNTVLQQLQLADANSSGNEWVFACSMKDLSGQTILSTSTAIIAAPPTVTFSTTTETRDWNIYMFGSDLFIGGNMLLAASDVAAVEATGGQVEEKWRLT